jgi:hypothetical protein
VGLASNFACTLVYLGKKVGTEVNEYLVDSSNLSSDSPLNFEFCHLAS